MYSPKIASFMYGRSFAKLPIIKMWSNPDMAPILFAQEHVALYGGWQ